MYYDDLQGNPKAVLEELKQLRKEWRRQDFKYTRDQQQRYDLLTELRRSHVKYYYENSMVWVGPSNAGKPFDENTD